jgi:D-alanyl-lipoteichoic acid acyltransferase DltB (MBOAT superfamily)
MTPLRAILGIYAYMFYIYFDFSGYTDMAIGTAQLVGIYLPENFNYPFLKRNLQQFWANWHMSLTTWLTDYIYWPLAKKIRHLKELKTRPVALSCICIIITFMICGLWHGDGLNFFIWGTYHGVGLAILNIYSQFEKKHFSLKWKKIINTSRFGYSASCFITFQYAAFGFLMFGCDMAKLKRFFNLF